MTRSQIVGFVVAIAAIGGGMVFYAVNPRSVEQKDAKCVAVATALPLVNTTTGMGMSVAIAACE
jgi:hypothetical protein